ncbi:Spx/MgsR family RNA polymerase-binding regulatory protein [Saccharospirillum impatiens]|uniref:Spx/MgsR family RNA polymerase-binding regulatory protein n=1 Tax=Saccharospirillum impatiens TaxID=169438 RepID=UPI0003F532B6|nr:Spx/MgsR family RNA polymerase-binding regulatory protein [Saccharospirillum impatiens]
MIRIYGIRNCDTIKKTLAWFAGQPVDIDFIDYKKTPPNEPLLRTWLTQLDWEQLVNKRGTTWRKLPQDLRDTLTEEGAIKQMIDNPSLIKRPLVDHDGTVSVGYDEPHFAHLVAQAR